MTKCQVSATNAPSPSSDAFEMRMLSLHGVSVLRLGVLLGAGGGTVEAFDLTLLPISPALLLSAHLAGHLAGDFLMHSRARALKGRAA